MRKDFSDYLMDIFIGILVVIAAAIFLVMLFFLVDSTFLDNSEYKTNIVSTEFEPGYFQTVVTSTGKTTSTSTIWIPDSWYAHVLDEDKIDRSCPISKEDYNRLSKGENVTALLAIGRLSGDTYCNGLKGYEL